MATKVTLRLKSIQGGKQSLYLDYYPAVISPKTGKETRREFLKMYVLENPKTPDEKRERKEILQTGDQIRYKRQNELNKSEVYTGYELEQLKKKQKGEQNFVEYYKSLADQRKLSNHDNWISSYQYLIDFTKGHIRFADIDDTFCNNYKEYLLSTKSNMRSQSRLSQNSAFSYFNKFKATLKQAYKDGYFQTDINARIKPIKPEETQRKFLSIDELNTLIKTESSVPLLKNAAIFSALTGLRFSDIQRLSWGEIEQSEEYGIRIDFRQKKTKGVEYLPISQQALDLLGERRKPTDRVFEGLIYSHAENKKMYQWIGAAGITKHITFHCFRHTYATLLLSKGNDIYTVSKMLGHRELKTTQIYAKVVDDLKRAAADSIKLDFGN